MKNQFRRLFLAAGVCTLVGTTLLIAEESSGIAEVPFAFTIMNREMPAGNYVVEQINNGQVLKVRNEGTAETILCIAASRKSGPAGDPKLGSKTSIQTRANVAPRSCSSRLRNTPCWKRMSFIE